LAAIEGAKPTRGLRVLETRRARELRRLSPAAERILWARLKNRGLQGAKFVRSEPIDPYIADFACRSAKLVVEIDGATHSTDEERAHDRRRTAFLEAQGYRVVRFSNQQVYEDFAAIVDEIARVLAKPAR
jgi:very-short-patch-repair endonuclease